MKLTFPHMGYLSVSLEALFSGLGIDVVVPPEITGRTLDLGVRHSPESACLPLKINIGNFIEAVEQGADTIVMGGGVGPCRFGYYPQLEMEILKDLGLDVEMIVLEPPTGHVRELFERLGRFGGKCTARDIYTAARLAWRKLLLCEEIIKLAHKRRPYAVASNTVDRAVQASVDLVKKARSPREYRLLKKKIKQTFDSLELDKSRSPVRVAVLGEIYTVVEPYVNQNIEQKLGTMGALIERSVMITEWAKQHLLLDALHLRSDHTVRELAKPYINHFVGGHGVESVGLTIEYAKRGFDGIVHLLPLTCMPEIIAQTVLPEVSRSVEIPVLSLVLDEQTASAGFETRLEAFIDLLYRRRRKTSHFSR